MNRGVIVCAARVFILIFSIVLISCSSGTKKTISPNIVLIMADDLGYGDIGCFGSNEYRTPNIDQLASDGITFTDYHSNVAVCTPTRAALLTGRYQQRAGLEGVIYVSGQSRKTGMDIEEYTIADALKAHGYQTAIFGKWHLGYHKKFFPVHQGFDRFYGYVSGNVDYISHYDNAGIYDWWSQTDSIYEEGYVTDLITDKALDFIEEHKDLPFFAYIAHEAPHWPYQGRNDRADRLAGVPFDSHGSRQDRQQAYKEMVEIMDENVGRVIDKLSELGLEENTLVIFCSDNGGVPKLGNNKPFAKHKGTLWEGGHRVPAAIKWPGKIRAGAVSDQTVLSMDWYPTILSIVANDKLPVGLDGIDLKSHILKNDKSEERSVFWRYREQKAVRKGEWKYLVENEDEYLFNPGNDKGETTNLIDEQSAIANQLKNELQAWEADVDKVPQKTN